MKKSEKIPLTEKLLVEEKWHEKSMNRIGLVLVLGVVIFGYFAFQASQNPCKTNTLPVLTAIDKDIIPSNCMNNKFTLPNGLIIEDTIVGTGNEIKKGSTVKMHYEGRLNDSNGTKFDSSFDRNEPFPVLIGDGKVIQGWDLGIPGMKVGGERILTIPASLGYGDRGAGGVIPPNATLYFRVQAVEIIN
jgi:FKBP-type peptidyl-prolyl cis-trans isomerase FkpA